MSIAKTSPTFDISQAEYNKDGVVNFYWPLDNKKSSEVMDSLTDNLIPYITDNEKKYPELIAVRLLFKWFLCEILRLFEATVLAEECKKDGIIPIIPKHYKRLEAIYHSNFFECEFFLNHSSGPSYGRKIPLTLKRFGKEFLWNGFNIGLFRKYESNQNDILTINPPGLAIKHAKRAKKLLRYSEYNEWFSSIPKSYITKNSNDSVAIENLVSMVQKSFSQAGYVLSSESTSYISIWLNQANNFVNYYLHTDNHLLNKVHGDIWFGCGGSSVWAVILIEKLRRKNIKVVTHDHGSGNSHHEQTPAHWVEFMHTDHFVTFNSINEKVKNAQFKKELIFGKKPPIIQSLDSVLGNTQKNNVAQNIVVKKKIKKVMYVGTAFHGEGARLRPIFHDMTYFDWQVKLLSHLKKTKVDVIYKPHPEGATKVPNGFVESLGFQSTTKKFEEINEDIDAYIIDFFFSSTTPTILKKNKPVFFINLGFPEIMPEALKLIKENCYYVKANYSSDSRLSIDFNKFDRFINKEEHIFKTSFSDVYFDNV